MCFCFLINKKKNLGITFSCGKKHKRKIGRRNVSTSSAEPNSELGRFSVARSNMSAATFVMWRTKSSRDWEWTWHKKNHPRDRQRRTHRQKKMVDRAMHTHCLSMVKNCVRIFVIIPRGMWGGGGIKFMTYAVWLTRIHEVLPNEGGSIKSRINGVLPATKSKTARKNFWPKNLFRFPPQIRSNPNVKVKWVEKNNQGKNLKNVGRIG